MRRLTAPVLNTLRHPRSTLPFTGHSVSCAHRLQSTLSTHNLPSTFENPIRIASTQKNWTLVQQIIQNGDQDQHARLTFHDLDDISKGLTVAFETNTPHQEPSHHHLAIFLAVRSRPSALVALMTRLLSHNKPESVILLWEDFSVQWDETSLRIEQDAHVDAAAGENPSLSSSMDNSSKVDHRQSTLGDVLGCAVIACTMLEDHNLALRASIRAKRMIPIYWERTVALGKKYLSTGASRARLREFIADAKTVRLVARPYSASRRFAQVFRNGEIRIAATMYDACRRGMTSSPPWISPIDTPGWETDGRYIVTFSEPLWSLMVSGFMRVNRPDLARSVWQHMGELGVKQGPIVWNALLDGYGKRLQYDELVTVWKAMDEHKIPKDLFAYTSIMSALFQMRKAQEAVRLFDEMRAELAANTLAPLQSPVPLDDASIDGSDVSIQAQTTPVGSVTYAFNAVIHGLLICGQAPTAQNIFDMMKTVGPKPDITTFNTLLRHHGRKVNMSEFAATLRDLGRSDVRPDVFTFTSTLHVFLRSGKRDQAIERVGTVMAQMGIKPNEVTYSALIDSVARDGGEENVNAAFDLLHAMEKARLTPNEVTFTGLLAALQRDTSLSPEYVARKRAEILRRMDKAGIQANRITFNVLIKACLERPGIEGISAAVEKYQEMVEQGVHPTQDTWFMLIKGAADREEFDQARTLINMMQETGFVSQGALARLIDKVVERAGRMM